MSNAWPFGGLPNSNPIIMEKAAGRTRHRLHAIAGGTQHNVVAACFARCIVAARSSQFPFARPLVPSAARAERMLLSSRGISTMAAVMGGRGGAIAHHARHTQWCYCCHNSLKYPMTHPCMLYLLTLNHKNQPPMWVNIPYITTWVYLQR